MSSKVSLISVVRRNPLRVLAVLALTQFAITNKVGIDSYSFQFPIGAHLERLANVFRASRRIFWLVQYHREKYSERALFHGRETWSDH